MASELLAAAPRSDYISSVAVSVEEGSITELALKAVREEYTESWLERYTDDPILRGEVLSPALSPSLPLSNPIAGTEKGESVQIMDLDTGTVLSLVFRDGRIIAADRLETRQGAEL